MIITLIGIDGSGKTTIALIISKALTAIDSKARSIVIYAGNSGIRLGRNHSFYMSILVDVIINKILHIDRKQLNIKYNKLLLVEEFLLFLNYLLLVLPKILLSKHIFKYVICDRYIYDYILTRMLLHKLHSRTLMYILLRIVPQPDKVILLDVDERVAFFRKNNEKTLHELRILRMGYLVLSKHINSSIVINATKPIRNVFKDVLYAILFSDN